MTTRTSHFAFPTFLCCLLLLLALPNAHGSPALPSRTTPVKIIFDTDIGNDVDDVLALSMLHALQTRRDCELLAVTITKPDEHAGPFVDAMNTFYGRPKIPIGCIRPSPSNERSKFLSLAEVKDNGKLRFPHHLKRSSDAPQPAPLLRKILSCQPDNSVILVQVGFFRTSPHCSTPPAIRYHHSPGASW
jgi:hypothetical protein